ncbi:MAG: DUF1194 domain-containing protein [Rhizobiales bacterium]|nr:DUF1194 domain-containing protein [Hyphomicrobiales bacterium]
MQQVFGMLLGCDKMIRAVLFRFIILTCLASLSADVRAAGAPVDLALVLAVDASGSVDDGEFILQLEGIAAGFRDPKVRGAITSGPEGRIAVMLLVWADHQVPKDRSDWFVLSSEEDAETFAGTVETFARHQNGATGIGEGLAAAIRAIDASGFGTRRRVVDVSGDGRETAAREFVVLLPQARAMAYARGVTVNGLAITNEDPELLSYYQNAVQAGPGSFTLPATDYAAFAEAMRRKLLREIEYRPAISQR